MRTVPNLKLWGTTLVLMTALSCGGPGLTNSEVVDIYAVCDTNDGLSGQPCTALATDFIEALEAGGSCDFQDIIRAMRGSSHNVRRVCPIPNPNLVSKVIEDLDWSAWEWIAVIGIVSLGLAMIVDLWLWNTTDDVD